MKWHLGRTGKVGIQAVGVLLLVSLASSKVLLDGFERVEDESVRQLTRGAGRAFDQNVRALSEKFVDWAAWDDLYRFAEVPDPKNSPAQTREIQVYREAFVRSNLVPEALGVLRVRLIAIVGADGRVLWGQNYDARRNRYEPLSQALRPRLRPAQSGLLRPGAVSQGLLQLENGMTVVAAHPIVRSDRSGTPRGWFVVGRDMDAEEWGRLRLATGLDLSFLPASTSSASTASSSTSSVPGELELQALRSLHASKKNAGGEEEVVVAVESEQRHLGFLPLRDLDGQLLGALKLSEPRTLREQGWRTLRGFLLVLWTLGLSALGVLAWVTRRSEARFRALVRNGWDIVAILRPPAHSQVLGQVLPGSADEAGPSVNFISPAVSRILGVSPEEMQGQSVGAWVHPFDRTHVLSEMKKWLRAPEGEMLGPLSCRWKHADGSWRTLEMTGAHLPHEPDIAGLVVNARDISERERDLARLHASRAELEESHALLKGSSAQVEASLREKEVLLKEIHHRVKNNMQVISSILSLQSAMLDDPGLRLALREMQGRIKSMALIHEKLYRSDDLARVDFADYLRVLCNDLLRSHPPHGSRRPAKLDLDLDLLSLNIEQAAPCGLLVNELVSNSLKHAFKDFDRDETPLVRVRLARGNASESDSESLGEEVVIEVSDNGRGMKPGIDWRTGDSLGLQLVETLAEQLEGEIECLSPLQEHPQVLGGTLWRLRFRARVESDAAGREQVLVGA